MRIRRRNLWTHAMKLRTTIRPALVFLALTAALPAAAQLDETCVVSALNRTAPVEPGGAWVLPNVPANVGQVRVRATCVEDGVSRFGQSGLLTVPANGVIQVAEIDFDDPLPIPEALTLSAPATRLTAAGETVQLEVTATFPGGASADVTAAATGTDYTISNAAVASLGPDGLFTALASGVVLVSAAHDGALGLLQLEVAIGGDSDGDGLPDDFELANGLDPNDPVDALEDPDADGLTTLDEFQAGLDPFAPDTDGDGLFDGEEVSRTGTDPRLFDTDGDGLSDGLEVATGSDPLDPASFNLAAALASIEVSPAALSMTVNTLLGEASRRLSVTGNLIDGTTLALTSTAFGTRYLSSDLAVCNFGAPDGRVFAGSDGTCTVTVSNAGHAVEVPVAVTSFSPTALSFVDLPGFAWNVDLAGDFAFVAAGAAGLVVVDVADRAAPAVVAALDTPGEARDVRVVGDLAYLADGPAGLFIADVSDPVSPAFAGALDSPGFAEDVVVKGHLAYLADGAAGLFIADVSDPSAPAEVGALGGLGTVQGVDVAPLLPLVAVALGTAGLGLVDVTDPAAPALSGAVATGDARDVALGQGFAFVADHQSSLTSVDVADPANPVVRASTPLALGGRLVDVTLAGGFAFGADIFFVNGVPIVDVSVPESPVPRAILDFRSFRDDNGTGIAADATHAYLTAARGSSTRLYVGQYLRLEADGGEPPAVTITSPSTGAEVIEGTTLAIVAEAVDDSGVLSVAFRVDGETVFTDFTAPYQFNLPVPAGRTSLTLGATAFDLAGNVGMAEEVVVGVVPDPLTTVTGTVVDTDGRGVDGAQVTTLGERSSTTGVGGTFFIADVPTILGDVVVTAAATVDGEPFSGVSAAVPPSAGGTTDVGEIVVSPFFEIGIATGQDADGDGRDDSWSMRLPDGTFFPNAPLVTPNPGWRGGSALPSGPFGSPARYPVVGSGRWIGASAAGLFVFETSFQLGGFGDVRIAGEWDADNAVHIFLNGNDTGIQSGPDATPPSPWLSNTLGSSHPCASPLDGRLHPNCDGPNPFCPANVSFRCANQEDEFREIHFFEISAAEHPEWFSFGALNTLRVEVRNFGGPAGLLITGGEGTSVPSGAAVGSSPPVRACGALPGDPEPSAGCL